MKVPVGHGIWDYPWWNTSLLAITCSDTRRWGHSQFQHGFHNEWAASLNVSFLNHLTWHIKSIYFLEGIYPLLTSPSDSGIWTKAVQIPTPNRVQTRVPQSQLQNCNILNLGMGVRFHLMQWSNTQPTVPQGLGCFWSKRCPKSRISNWDPFEFTITN